MIQVKGIFGAPKKGFSFTYSGDMSAIETVDYGGVLYQQVKLLTSGTLIPLSDAIIDAFLVAGGGGSVFDGGGGGYTDTQKNIPLQNGEIIIVSIGAGGIHGTYTPDTTPTAGGETRFNCLAGNFSALGGKGSIMPHPYGGGSGGSGGGQFGTSKGGNAGTDGSDGPRGDGSLMQAPLGIGQHTTTRAFGEPDGELYADGGPGGASTAANTGNAGLGGSVRNGNGKPNTGAGASGVTNAVIPCVGFDGGSGIVIMRWLI